MKPTHLALIALASTFPAACGGDGQAAWRDAAPPEAVVDSGYLEPPAALAAAVLPSGAIVITGRAVPKARVRLITPAGQALTATADAAGAWRIEAPANPQARLFGLSMATGDRVQQAAGYLLVTPDGVAAQLRSGAGAITLTGSGPTPSIRTVDFDHDGGGVISGRAKPGVGLAVRIDRSPAGDGKADAHGRFSLALTRPLRPGAHHIDISGEGGGDAIDLTLSPTKAPQGQAFTAAGGPGGWRVDWITPGGGAQTTLVLKRAGAAA